MSSKSGNVKGQMVNLKKKKKSHKRPGNLRRPGNLTLICLSILPEGRRDIY
jgi:hypothetical protein